MDKENVVPTHQRVKTNKMVSFAGRWVGLESIMSHEINQAHKLNNAHPRSSGESGSKCLCLEEGEREIMRRKEGRKGR